MLTAGRFSSARNRHGQQSALVAPASSLMERGSFDARASATRAAVRPRDGRPREIYTQGRRISRPLPTLKGGSGVSVRGIVKRASNHHWVSCADFFFVID